MSTKISSKTWRISSLLAAIGIVLYIATNFLSNVEVPDDVDYMSSITKSEAEQIAYSFASKLTGEAITKTEIVHNADKDYTGYINKYELIEEHLKKLESIYPYDWYQVHMWFPNHNTEGIVYVNLTNGDVVGWELNLYGEYAVNDELVAQALENHGFPYSDSETMIELSDSSYFVTNNKLNVGDTKFELFVEVSELNGKQYVSTYLPTTEVPKDYLASLEPQDLWANIFTYGGYMLFTFVFAILAIIYAILYRHHTSFKYGIVLTVIACLISIIYQASAIKSQVILEDGAMEFDVITSIIMYAIIFVSTLFAAIGYYFSFVAGDGLWKAQGFNLWPRFKEASFGNHVWDSMKLSYLFAFIGLGLQAVIFEILTLTLGTFQANDTSSSALNMEWMWFYPALAWMAAITEEVTFRYFGVGIFRRWFKNTFAAALIPSLIWAFGHTLYPLYPVSTRIIELVILGVIISLVMVKFGFIVAMYTHAIFNTLMMSLVVIIYGETVDMIMGIVFIVLPIIISYVLRALHRKQQKKLQSIPPQQPDYTQSQMPYPNQ